jgi:hypothetical protein
MQHEDINRIVLRNVTFSYPLISPQELASYRIMLDRLEKLGSTQSSEWIDDRIHFLKDAFLDADVIPPVIIENVSYTFKK